MRTDTLKLHEQRFMVSPCGFHARFVHADAIAANAADWTDVTHLGDAEVCELMVRRMWSGQWAA
jgi:hypothetical protein